MNKDFSFLSLFILFNYIYNKVGHLTISYDIKCKSNASLGSFKET